MRVLETVIDIFSRVIAWKNAAYWRVYGCFFWLPFNLIMLSHVNLIVCSSYTLHLLVLVWNLLFVVHSMNINFSPEIFSFKVLGNIMKFSCYKTYKRSSFFMTFYPYWSKFLLVKYQLFSLIFVLYDKCLNSKNYVL